MVPQPAHMPDDGVPGITPAVPLPLVPLIELPAAPLTPLPLMPLVELPAAPLPLAEPPELVELPTAPLPLAELPEQLPEVPAAVADVPYSASREYKLFLDALYVEGRHGVLLVRQLRQLGPLVAAQEARQVVVEPWVIQLMALGVVEPWVVQLVAPGVVVSRVGSPVRRHPAYEQIERPPLLEPIE